jgi:hypothetical protein
MKNKIFRALAPLLLPPLLPMAALPAGGDPAPAGVPVIGTDSLQGWSVECHNGWRPENDLLRCNGPSSAEIKAVKDPSPALELDWRLEFSDWSQAVRAFPEPADFSNMEALRLDLRGISRPDSDGQLVVLFSDADGIFYGCDVLGPAQGIQEVDRWQARLLLPRKSFSYRFNTRGQPPADIDWSRIERFYMAVVRPCTTDETDPKRVCFGGGAGRVLLDRWEVETPGRLERLLSGPESSAPAGRRRLPSDFNQLILWKEPQRSPEPLWSQESAPLGTSATVLLDASAPERWRAECDGKSPRQEDLWRCKGLSSGLLKRVDGSEGAALRLEWDMREGEWVQARHLFSPAVDLSSAEAVGFSLRGAGPLGAPYSVGLLLADADDVFYGYMLDLSHMDFKGRWRVNVALPRDSLYYHFNPRGGGAKIDWSRIDRFFFGVKHLSGAVRAPLAGDLEFIRLQVRSPVPPAARPAPPAPRLPARQPSEEQWGYTIYFPEDDASVPVLRLADVEKVAEHLRLYRDHDVLVTGFADKRETHAQRLADERAKALATLLFKQAGIAPERIHAASAPLRITLQGERLQKAVIRFLDKEERPKD